MARLLSAYLLVISLIAASFACTSKKTATLEPDALNEVEGPEIPIARPRHVPGPGLSRSATTDFYSSLEGTWVAASVIQAGQELPEHTPRVIKLKLDDETFEANLCSGSDEGAYIIDSASKPRKLTLKGDHGPNAGKTILAIYDFPEAETMRVCYDLTGASFPTGFESTSENGYFLAIYKKQAL